MIFIFIRNMGDKLPKKASKQFTNHDKASGHYRFKVAPTSRIACHAERTIRWLAEVGLVKSLARGHL